MHFGRNYELMLLKFAAKLIGKQQIKILFKFVMYPKFRLTFILAHRLLSLKQKDLKVANTLPAGDNQSAHLAKDIARKTRK